MYVIATRTTKSKPTRTMEMKLEHAFNDFQYEISLRDPAGSSYITAIITADWDDESEEEEPPITYAVEVISSITDDMLNEANTVRDRLGAFETEGEAIRAMTKRLWHSQQRLLGNDVSLGNIPSTYKFKEKR